MKNQSSRTLQTGFLRSCELFADREALVVNCESLTYADLYERSAQLAATLQKHVPDEMPPLTGLLVYRTATAFAGVLAALMRGHGYVPLNPNFPTCRLTTILQTTGCRGLVVDEPGEEQLAALLAAAPHAMVLLLPHRQSVSDLAEAWPGHTFLGSSELLASDDWQPIEVQPDAIAYLLFTSGSTGQPKGVMVSHRNAVHFIDVMVARYEISEHDRLSQMFEMVFDVSVFDMFAAWERGACVCVPTRADRLTPARYINEAKITIWFSVPSTGLLMKKLRMLEPGLYPTLRFSLFIGEALPAEIAEAWSHAAPNSIVENLYGPTELTVACTLYRWDPECSPEECEHGTVPIGHAFQNLSTLVVDQDLCEVPSGETGELLMAGPQVTLGYWQDPERTAVAFVVPPGKDAVYYRTGDLVRKPLNDGPITFLGRIDNQIQIHGYRVELGEVESSLREAAGVGSAIAVGWPVSPGGAEGIVAFLETTTADTTAVRAVLKARLPDYMVPREIRLIPQFPLNTNGKVDRKALMESLKPAA